MGRVRATAAGIVALGAGGGSLTISVAS